MRQSLTIMLIYGFVFLAHDGHAQNVSNYAGISEPLLFLLREPAVHGDLGLSDRQRGQLVKLNEQLDGRLLSTRNKTPETAQKSVSQMISTTGREIKQILTAKQLTRFRQITYRVRGISSVLLPDARQQLLLSNEQQQEIQGIVEATVDALESLQRQLAEGQMSRADGASAAAKSRAQEQRQVWAALSQEQQQTLLTMMGPKFDVNQLGKVSFRAPKWSTDGTWINTPPLDLSKLNGKVIALHFWTFG